MSRNSLTILKVVLILSILSLSGTNSVCSSSAYVSASDASSYASAICATAVANTKYRIQGGASLSCSYGSPSVTSSDPNVLTQALCIKITTTPGGSSSSTSDIPKKMSQPPGCPANYIQATYSQALTYKNEICSTLNEWDIVALQGGGSIRGPGYSCAVTAFDDTSMGHIACVPMAYIGPVTTATVTIVNAGENVCSSCQSLITTAEASTYYTSIPVGTTARIAGGSSVQRTSTSAFTILNHDTVSRSSQICASIPRAGCPTSSYLTSSCTCQACLNSCYTCSGLSYCDSCSPLTGFPFSYNRLCYNPCPQATFESSPATCDDCSNNCFTCSGNADYCTSCNPASSSKYLYRGVCYATCPSGTYAASTSRCEDCASPCQTCSSTSTTCTTCLSDFPYFLNDYCYKTCPDGFYNDPLTKTCPRCSNDCTTCEETADKCTSCSSLTSTPFLYENKCFAQCPAGSFLSSSNTCSICSKNCATCVDSADKCTSCSGDFPNLENSHCVAASSELPKITRSFSKTSNIGFTVDAALVSSGTMAIFTGLLFKLIGYIKYLDILYPNNLEQALQNWQSDLVPSVFPEMSQKTKNKLKAKSIPEIYVKRKIAPTFLENFWFPMWNLGVSFFALGCVFLAAFYCKRKEKKNGERILKYLLKALVNFIIIQLYFHCGDIFLFFILEIRSIDFGSALSVLSFCISVVFVSIVICTLTLHSFILFRYTDAYQKKKISEFEEKYARFKILFDAFKGSSFLPSSYLLLFTLRDVTLNLVISLLFEHVLAQAILFICICVAFLGYLIIIRPFKKTLENWGQYFFEALVLLTYFAVLLIRCAEASDWNNQEKIKDRLGMGILVIALIFSAVSTVLMIFSLARMCLYFSKDLKTWLALRKGLKKVHIIPENSHETQENLNVTMRPNLNVETDNSSRALDDSPVRPMKEVDKDETALAHNTMLIQPSFDHSLSLAERIQLKRSQNNSSIRREKHQFELFNNSSVIQEESDQTSRSQFNLKFNKPEASDVYANQSQSQSQSRLLNLSSRLNSINLTSNTRSASNINFLENRFSRLNGGNFRNPSINNSRIINFSSDRDLSTSEIQKHQL